MRQPRADDLCVLNVPSHALGQGTVARTIFMEGFYCLSHCGRINHGVRLRGIFVTL